MWAQRSNMDGALLTSVAYGIHATLFFLCFNILASRGRKTRRDWALLVYTCLVFTFGSLGYGMVARWVEMMFVDNINFPGGPAAFNYEESNDWVNVVGVAFYIVGIWLQDGLLLWRFFIIYRRNIYLTLIPATAFLASFVLGCLMIADICNPSNNFYAGFAAHILIIFLGLSAAYNTVLTLGIVLHLMYMRLKLKALASLSTSSTMTPYVSVSAMLIESAMLYTVNALIFVISFALNSNLANLVLGPLGQTTSIAPLMIIYRVLVGRAWSDDTFSSFAHSEPSTLGKNNQMTVGLPMKFSTPDFNNTVDTGDDMGAFTVNVSRQNLTDEHV